MVDEIPARRREINALLDTIVEADGPDHAAQAQVLALLEIADAIDNVADVIETTARWFVDRADRDL